MDSSTQHANGAALEGATGPEFTPLRRTTVAAGAADGHADSVPRGTLAAALEPARAPAAGDANGDEEVVAPRRPAQRRAAAPTATDFTSERLLRPRAEVPRSGLRRLIYRLTGGRVNLGPSPAALAERAMVARAKGRGGGCPGVPGVSRQGGGGEGGATRPRGH